MTPHSDDDGFHEIQLNGKQLAFLFMAATVVSVVIFLSGVLVGRGVRAERLSAEAAVTGESPSPDVRAPGSIGAPAIPAGSDPTVAAPPPPASEDLSYAKRLGQEHQPEEELKPAARRAAVVPSAPAPQTAASNRSKGTDHHVEKVEKPAAKPAGQTPTQARPDPTPSLAADATHAPPPSRPVGRGYVVQVAAFNVRSEADAVAKRLGAKGYSAYVLPPADGAPSIFRVRVGSYKTKREADSIAAKLHREERVKPWVTR